MQHFRGICSLVKALLVLTVVATATLAQAQERPVDYPQRMQLSANGQSLTLLLRPSSVTENLRVVNTRGVSGQVPVKTYTGKIKGDSNSWVRLTQSNNALDGVISRYGKRFRLQQSGGGSVRITPVADKHDHRITITNNNAKNRFIAETTSSSKVTHVAKIGIVVDSQFNAQHNGKGLEYALSLINSVDGIYREEFGLALQVETAINITDAESDPFTYGSVAVETMLRGFRDYRMQTTLLDPRISLVHLFTGNRPADEPVGLAWIDTACRTDGYDVGLSTPYRHDILLVAHEIAHNLGALHDSDTACAATTDNVMWPYISAATTQQFSSCTVETVKRSIANSCHAQAIDLELALSVDEGNTVKATVRNTDGAITNPAATLAVDLPAGSRAMTLEGDCSIDAPALTDRGKVECTIGTLAPGADSVVLLQVDTSSVNVAMTNELFASVSSNHFTDVASGNNTGTITADENTLAVVSQNNSNAADFRILRADDQSGAVLPSGETSGTGSFLPISLFALAWLVSRRRAA